MEKDNQWPNSCMSQVMVDQLKDMEKSNSMSHAILDMRSQILMGSSKEWCLLPSPSPKLLIWLCGFASVTIISLSSLIGLFILPKTAHNKSSLVLNLLEGIAVGSLLGSALFHLIPNAFELVGEEHEHDYLSKSVVLFAGFYLFYWSEKLMILVNDYRSYRKSILKAGDKNFSKSISSLKANKCLSEGTKIIKTNGINYDSIITNDENTEHIESDEYGTAAWMVIIGDGIHNFIDGMSLGAALTKNIWTGFSISVAILFEEIPHELGDFAVLIASGMSPKKAAFYNFASAATCYLGMVIGILLGDIADSNRLIFALASGMFLYISLVCMLPELSDGFNMARKRGSYETCKILFVQNLGILFGITLLFLLAKHGEKIQFNDFINQIT